MQVKNIVAYGCLTLAGATLPGCKPTPTTQQDVQSTSLSSAPWNHIGEGVYTFEYDETWPTSLIKFREENPALEITAIYADKENRAYGGTSTVLIVTEER